MCIDSIIVALKQSDFGCHIDNAYTGCPAYADNLMLISDSVTKLQKC